MDICVGSWVPCHDGVAQVVGIDDFEQSWVLRSEAGELFLVSFGGVADFIEKWS